MNTMVRVLARALCDSSSHVNLLPHDEQRPCEYHLKRAADTLTLLRDRGYGLGQRFGTVASRRIEDEEAERSRLNAENLRTRTMEPFRRMGEVLRDDPYAGLLHSLGRSVFGKP